MRSLDDVPFWSNLYLRSVRSSPVRMKNHIENIKILRLPNFYIREPREACKYWFFQPNIVFNLHFWRSGRDSNPRGIAPKLISSQPRYDHFDTAACIFRNISPQKTPRKKERTDGENYKSFSSWWYPQSLEKSRFFRKAVPKWSLVFESGLLCPPWIYRISISTDYLFIIKIF